MNLANEGLEAKRKEDEVVQRKRKAEDDKSWEGALLFYRVVCPLLHPWLSRGSRASCG
jgi:hypothetical protein